MIAKEILIIVYFVLNLFSLYSVQCFISLFLSRKIKVRLLYRIMPYIIYAIIGVLTYIWEPVAIINTMCTSLLTFIITLNFQGILRDKIVVTLLKVIFQIIIELVVGISFAKVIDVSFSEVVYNDLLRVICVTYIVIVTLVVIKLVELIVKKRKDVERITLIDSFQILIIPLCSIAILYVFMITSLNDKEANWGVVVSIVLVAFINVFFFYLFDRLKEMEELKYDNELLKNQSEYYVKLEESINSSFDKVRTIKHDLKHQLLFLKSKATENTDEVWCELNETLDFLIGETLSDEIVEYTKNVKLNRLLNYKLFDVLKKGIDVELKVNIREDAYLDENNMYVILGNAIDNAVENYNADKSSIKKINIRIVEDSNNLFIKISNPYYSKLVIKNGLPITTKENKSMHGIGLRSIKRIVEEKDGYFKIKAEDNVFLLEVLLYDEIK